jgi:predicted Fe-Mo cluster-binding NifX family protein
MSKRHILNQYCLRWILVVSSLLQSCTGLPHETTPPQGKTFNTQDTTKQLTDKRFTAQGGYIVHLYEEQGYLRANVKETLFHAGFNKTYHNFPVYIAEGIDLAQVAILSTQAQERLIHVSLNQDGQSGSVYIGHTALMDTTSIHHVKNKDIEQPTLHLAAKKDYLHIVELLLAKGADIHAKDENGDSALHVAIAAGHIKVIKLLLTYGADLNEEDKEDSSPLHIAASTGQLKAAKLLIKKGANIDAQNKDGITPLHIAASNAHQNIVHLLLEYGADVNATCNDGWSALHSAACDGHIALVKLLLAYGADANVTVKDGNTPLDVAIQNGHTAVANLLAERGECNNV